MGSQATSVVIGVRVPRSARARLPPCHGAGHSPRWRARWVATGRQSRASRGASSATSTRPPSVPPSGTVMRPPPRTRSWQLCAVCRAKPGASARSRATTTSERSTSEPFAATGRRADDTWTAERSAACSDSVLQMRVPRACATLHCSASSTALGCGARRLWRSRSPTTPRRTVPCSCEAKGTRRGSPICAAEQPRRSPPGSRFAAAPWIVTVPCRSSRALQGRRRTPYRLTPQAVLDVLRRRAIRAESAVSPHIPPNLHWRFAGRACRSRDRAADGGTLPGHNDGTVRPSRRTGQAGGGRCARHPICRPGAIRRLVAHAAMLTSQCGASPVALSRGAEAAAASLRVGCWRIPFDP